MSWSQETIDALLEDLFDEGKTNLIVGRRGQAKTTLAAYFLNWLLPRGYKIATNIIFKECTGHDEKGRPLFKEAFPEGVIKVKNFYELFDWTGKQLEEDRYAKLVLIVDEAGVSIASVKPAMMVSSRAWVYFSQLARKFNLNSLFITVSRRMLLKAIRSAEGGIMGATFSKMPEDLQKYALNTLTHRDEREVFVLKYPDRMLDEDDVEVFWIEGVKELPFCKPQHLAEVGDIVFSSKSTATFTLGYFPGTKVPFDVESCLDYLSDVIEEEVAGRIKTYLENRGFVDEAMAGDATVAKKHSKQRKREQLEKAHHIVKRIKEAAPSIGFTELAREVAQQIGGSTRNTQRILHELGYGTDD